LIILSAVAGTVQYCTPCAKSIFLSYLAVRESVLHEQSLHGATLATQLEPPFTSISTPLAQPNRRCLLFPRVSCGAPFTRALPRNCAPSSLMSRWGFHKDSKPILCPAAPQGILPHLSGSPFCLRIRLNQARAARSCSSGSCQA
jgi:hypothetical protein